MNSKLLEKAAMIEQDLNKWNLEEKLLGPHESFRVTIEIVSHPVARVELRHVPSGKFRTCSDLTEQDWDIIFSLSLKDPERKLMSALEANSNRPIPISEAHTLVGVGYGLNLLARANDIFRKFALPYRLQQKKRAYRLAK